MSGAPTVVDDKQLQELFHRLDVRGGRGKSNHFQFPMRKIGDFHDAAQARALGEYLLALQISNQVDPEQDGRSWSVLGA